MQNKKLIIIKYINAKQMKQQRDINPTLEKIKWNDKIFPSELEAAFPNDEEKKKKLEQCLLFKKFLFLRYPQILAAGKFVESLTKICWLFNSP